MAFVHQSRSASETRKWKIANEMRKSRKEIARLPRRNKMTESLFQDAKKQQLKARLALDGPTGAGKTWTALSIATVLAEGGKIAMIDTEKRSGLFYAKKFQFKHMDFREPYEPHRLVSTLKAAEAEGFSVVIIDSFSHFWEGEGGMLDQVDAAASRSGGNTFAGWKVGTPMQRNMVDTILGLDLHVIVCMRSKMEYVLEEYEDNRGSKKTRPKKIGMKPVQREGVEYEFTVIGDMDLEHRITISKSRCDLLADQVIQPHREAEMAEVFLGWLNDGEEYKEPAKLADDDRELIRIAINELVPENKSLLRDWMKEKGLKLDRLDVEQAEGVLNWIEEATTPPLEASV